MEEFKAKLQQSKVQQEDSDKQVVPEDQVMQALAAMGQELAKVAGDEATRANTLQQIETLLGNLKLKDYQQLADSPIIQQFADMFAQGLKPGQVKNQGTLAEAHRDWTMQDIHNMVLNKEMTLVTFTPSESITLTFNGVSLHIIANEECQVPRCFYDIYKDRVKAVKQAQIHEAYLMGKSDTPPDPNWMTEESASVRAWSIQGRPLGRVSGILGVGRIYDVGEEAPNESKDK